MTQLRTLAHVHQLIDRIAATLDPESRYITELRAIVDQSTDVDDLSARLQQGCRGQRHAGPDVFAAMSVEDQVRANLITPETALFRFAEGELEVLVDELLPHLNGAPVRTLIVPCSHGEEAYTVAAFMLKQRAPFTLRAFDIQPALIEEARTGRLTFGYPLDYLDSPGYVATHVLNKIRFDIGDAFDLPLDATDTFELVLCRNFIGYFVPEVASRLVVSLANRMASKGVLVLDSFCIAKMPELSTALASAGLSRRNRHPVFSRIPLGREN